MSRTVKKNNSPKYVMLQYVIWCILGITACQSNKKSSGKTTVKTKTENSRSIEDALPLSNFREWKGQSLKMDSLFIASIDTFPMLTSEWVRKWSTVFTSTDKNKTPMNWVFNDYFFVDSINQTGTFESYAEKADIGDILVSESRSLYHLKLDTAKAILLWSIYHSSYEACPFTSGTEVFATFIYKGVAAQTVLVAENLSSMDAPAYYVKTIFSNYQSGVFDMHILIESGEEGGENEKSETQFLLQVRKQGFEAIYK